MKYGNDLQLSPPAILLYSMTSTYGLCFPKNCIIYLDPDQSHASGDCIIEKIHGKSEVTFKQIEHESGDPCLTPLDPSQLYFGKFKSDR